MELSRLCHKTVKIYCRLNNWPHLGVPQLAKLSSVVSCSSFLLTGKFDREMLYHLVVSLYIFSESGNFRNVVRNILVHCSVLSKYCTLQSYSDRMRASK